MTKNEKHRTVFRGIGKKRLLPMLLAVLMMVAVLAPGIAVSAAEMDEPPQIIINAPAGLKFDEYPSSYMAFKIYDVTFNGDNYSYTLVAAFEGFDDYPGADADVTLQEYLDSMPSPTEMTALAKALYAYITEASPSIDPVGDVTVDDNKVYIDLDVPDGGYGYYLVYSWMYTETWSEFDEEYIMDVQFMAACSLTTTNPIADITAKGDAPTLDKYIVLDDGSYTTLAGVTVGDIVNFAIEITLPRTFEGYDDYCLNLEDHTMNMILGHYDWETEEGFLESFNIWMWEKGNSTSKTLFPTQGYELSESSSGFLVNFDFEYLKLVPEGYDLLIEYSSVARQELAHSFHIYDMNSARVEFSFSPYEDPSNTSGTLDKYVTLYSTSIENIYKVDGESWNEDWEGYDILLGGAEFTLHSIKKLETPGEGGILYDISSPLTFFGDDGYTPNPSIYDGFYYEYYKTEDPEYYNYHVYNTVTSSEGAPISFWGLGPGLYMLKEVKAPDGYNKMEYNIFFEIEFVTEEKLWDYGSIRYFAFVESVYFDVDNDFLYDPAPAPFTKFFDYTIVDYSSDDSEEWIDAISESIYIENYSGTLFPGTGGPGTAIFFATSAMLTLGLATFVIISHKRKTTPTV